MSLGIGVMLKQLSGGSEHSASEYYGQKITSAAITDKQLALGLADGRRILIWDDGQSCCESRYLSTDDDIQSLVGHTLNRVEVKEGPTTGSDYGEPHETRFVEVGTDQGFITLVNHNEHNGYYGGFALTITEEK
jgi:hypothetical protein